MLVSIIIPVYNSEKYIEETVKSIIAQEFVDWELLIVDDGSTDNSGSICDRLSEQDERVKVFHTENRGVSSARNYGIAKAKGDYIEFVDGDDLLLPRTVKTAVDNIEDKELLIFGYENFPVYFKSCAAEKRVFCSFDEIISGYNFIVNSHLLNSPCNKLYKREIIEKNNLRFNSQYSMGEDRLFNLSYLKMINKVVVIPEVLYKYRRNVEDSLTHKFYKDFFEVQMHHKIVTDTTFNNDSVVVKHTSDNFVMRVLAYIKNCAYEESMSKSERIELVTKWINDVQFIRLLNEVSEDILKHINKSILMLVKKRKAKTICNLYFVRAKISKFFKNKT